MNRHKKLTTDYDTWQVIAVDDKTENLKLVKIVLESKGAVIEIFENYKDFSANVDRIRPNLILLDIAMPDVSGVELAKELRKDSQYDDVPIIAVTALAVLGEQAQEKMNLFDGYITKPFKVEQLMSKLDKAIKDFIEKRVGVN